MLRGGYGIFYDLVNPGIGSGGGSTKAIQTGFTQSTSVVPSLNNGLSFVATLSNPFPNGYLQPPGASAGLGTYLGQSVSYIDQNQTNPLLQRWSFGIQRQLPFRLLVSADYVGSQGRGIYATVQIDNIPRSYLSTLPVRDNTTISLLTAQVANPFYPLLPGTSLSVPTVARSQLLLPYPQFTGISVSNPIGRSLYNSLQTKLEKKLASGYTILAAYTWSKMMDQINYLNPTDPAPERVISTLDRPQRFVLSGVWELPVGRGRRFAGSVKGVAHNLISNWQFQAVMQAQSGAPIGFGNILFNGNIHDIVLPAGQRTPAHWFNASAGFVTAASAQPANNIRTFPSELTGLRAPANQMWNISAVKNWTIHERFKVQLRSEWLNAFNHTIMNAPVTSVTSLQFGQITGAASIARQIYFVLKLNF